MLSSLSIQARALLFFSLLFGSQAIVMAGIAFGWSPATFITAGVLLCVATAYVFVTGMVLVRRTSEPVSRISATRPSPMIVAPETSGTLR